MNKTSRIEYSGGGSSLALLLFCTVTVFGGTSAQAAVLDGMLTGVEESIAEHVAKKGEKLKTGNFYTAEKPNAHGPIGMMGDHTHDKGEVMFTYRYMQMFMEGNRNGTDDLSDAAVRGQGYAVVPTKMTMQMHMFGAMHGLTDTVTVTVMVPYILNSMDHIAGMPLGAVNFTTRSEGVGDIRFGSLWRLWAVEAPSIGAHRFHFNFTLSVPTGDIEPTDSTPAGGPNTRLPYPMHLGSGTVDVYPGLTYGGEMGKASWLVQAIGTIRTGRNYNGFNKGNAYEVNVAGGYEFTRWLSGSTRLSWNDWANYNGLDSTISSPPIIVPTADPNRRGGQRLDILGGINILFPEFMGFENRLAVEGGAPIYQWLRGPQLETDWIITVGWQSIY